MAERCDAGGSNGSRMMASNLLKMKIDKTVEIRYYKEKETGFQPFIVSLSDRGERSV